MTDEWTPEDEAKAQAIGVAVGETSREFFRNVDIPAWRSTDGGQTWEKIMVPSSSVLATTLRNPHPHGGWLESSDGIRYVTEPPDVDG